MCGNADNNELPSGLALSGVIIKDNAFSIPTSTRNPQVFSDWDVRVGSKWGKFGTFEDEF